MSFIRKPAPGAPGAEPRWTRSAKEGVGTAYSTSSRIWFTVGHGVLNEIYWPHVDTPATRDFQFLISDGESFVHEERKDLERQIELPELGALLYRITHSDRQGRYRLTKEIIADPHRSVVLVRVRLEITDASLRGKLKLYALLAPHLGGHGSGNNGFVVRNEQVRLLRAECDGHHLLLGCDAGFCKRSVGFVGTSDGWQDLHKGNFRMDWEYTEARDGNVALMGEVDLAAASVGEGAWEVTVGIGFGESVSDAATKTLQYLANPWHEQREDFVRQWQRADIKEAFDFAALTNDGGKLFRVSRNILLAHEDKMFEGALIASLSTPWGETKGDKDSGGYHLVWTRDLVQSATALLATGQTATPLRALIWLTCVQKEDGSFPQNSWIDGRVYWGGIQLDEMAAPLLLAWRLRDAGALGEFKPWPMISHAAAYLIKSGPITEQERWEENAGYSPYTLATVIAGLVAAAEFARERKEEGTADFLLAHADWLEENVDGWCSTRAGELLEGKGHHYLRITPATPGSNDGKPDPDGAEIQLGNGGGKHPARNIVGGDFLQLVRLGVRAADAPLVVDSLAVIDHVLKRDLPGGPCWRRYPYDGYGQKPDGTAYDGSGEGRSWPILTGERGHHELAAGRDPKPFVEALERFANVGHLLPEQLWDAPDSADGTMKFGQASGSAMPLCWSHAEYLCLVRSRRDGRVFDRIEPVFRRYVAERNISAPPIPWTLRHQVTKIPAGRSLRIIVESEVVVHWTNDAWKTVREITTAPSGLTDLWFADLATDSVGRLEWTFHWQEPEHWEGNNFQVEVTAAD